MFAISALAMFAPEAGSGETCSGMMGCIKYHFDAGGWGMWPILALCIVAILIIAERIMFLQRASIDKNNLVSHLKSQIMSGNIQGAIQVCSGNSTPLTRIIQAGLSHVGRAEKDVQSAM